MNCCYQISQKLQTISAETRERGNIDDKELKTEIISLIFTRSHSVSKSDCFLLLHGSTVFGNICRPVMC